MGQGGFTETGWAIEQDVVQGFTSTLGGSDSYVYIFLSVILPDEVSKAARSQVGIKRYILGTGFTRYNASYFASPPQ